MPSECAIGSTNEGKSYCSNDLVLNAMRLHPATEHCTSEDKECVVKSLQKSLKVQSESVIYNDPSFIELLSQVNPQISSQSLLNELFNPEGPSYSYDPINNIQQEAVMKLWANKTWYGKQFYPIQFQLSDFWSNPKERLNSDLANLDWHDLLVKGYRTFGVLINTSTSKEIDSGKEGKHWFCLFMEFRSLKTTDLHFKKTLMNNLRTTQCCTIEYFNSSGNLPLPSIQQYLIHLEKSFLKMIPGINIWTINASTRKHQFKNTCCGLYALFYIMQRLQNRSYKWFIQHTVTDKEMYELRAVLFRHDYKNAL